MLKRHSLAGSWLAAVAAGLIASSGVGAEELVIAGRDGIYGDALEKSAEAFEAVNPGTRIELLKLPYGSLYEKLTISLREGTSAYDVLLLDDTWATEFMQNGWLKELGAADGDFIPAALDISRFPVGGGKLYALPMVGNVELFAYREDLLKKHGFGKPASWSELLTAIKTIDEKEAGVSGVVFRGTKGNPIVTGFLPIFWAHGGSVVDAQGKPAVASAAGVKALEFYLQLKSYAPKGVEVYNATEVRDALEQGKAAVAIEVWPSWIPSLDDPAKSKVVNKMAIAPAPGETVGPSPMLGIWQVAIPAKAKNAETAARFLAFLTSQKNQKALALDLGLPPTRTSVYGDAEVVAKYRWYPAQLEALKSGKPRPRIVKWQQVETILGDYLQLALVGQMDARTALDHAQKDMEKALRD